jgi:small subunit ribosomal protein S16
MAVAIRLRRAGRKNHPFYHVVAIESRQPRDGSFLEKLGYYNPRTDPVTFTLDRERYQHWLSHGACPSRTVAQLVARLPKDESKPGS